MYTPKGQVHHINTSIYALRSSTTCKSIFTKLPIPFPRTHTVLAGQFRPRSITEAKMEIRKGKMEKRDNRKIRGSRDLCSGKSNQPARDLSFCNPTLAPHVILCVSLFFSGSPSLPKTLDPSITLYIWNSRLSQCLALVISWLGPPARQELPNRDKPSLRRCFLWLSCLFCIGLLLFYYYYLFLLSRRYEM